MAKVIAPFKIVGTLDDLNFYTDENNQNLVRTKAKTGVSSEEFKRNPIFTKARNHSKEFGSAVLISHHFRRLTHLLNNRAKDGSFAGRANKLLLEIIQEDNCNKHGERNFEIGINQPEVRSYFLGFEGNKTRPLKKVLKTKWIWNEENKTLSIKNLDFQNHIDWPDAAENVHFVTAYSIWNFKLKKFETQYSQEFVFPKEESTQNITLTIEKDKKSETFDGVNTIELAYCFIGFSTQQRKKTKELKRINNTLSIIWYK